MEGVPHTPKAARRFADAALAAMVVMMVAMMIIPLPTWLLDILIATNVSIAVLLLLVAMYISNGLQFAAFPTVLLVTTLYRLALNVSSTRLILSQADAGEVIDAFGGFVVQGNYVVGAVVFLILTLIQFLVVAKGSERVAEVGARFTLDAMPGKQMSIDAELRNGGINPEEARRRRTHLERESQFYGAMDGAMKFVKGDAIAGIVITAINIVGGLTIGMAMQGMSAAEALRTFGLLTIGDGLVSQIPALLISTAAGLVVTRVAAEDAESSLGSEVARQIFGHPRALLIAGAFLLVLALVPGLPVLPFGMLAALFLVLGFRLQTLNSNKEALRRNDPETAHKTALQQGLVPTVVPVAVDVGASLAAQLNDVSPDFASQEVAAVRQRLFSELGVTLPAVVVRSTTSLAPNEYQILVQEIPVQAASLGPTDADPRQTIAAALFYSTRRRAQDFVGLQETQTMLDQLDRTYPALVQNCVPRPVKLALLADVLSRLVEEGVSIRPLREILEALAVFAAAETDPVTLTEKVRGALRRQITHRHAHNGIVGAYMLEPSIEDAIRDAIQHTDAGSFLAMQPDLAKDVRQRIVQTCASNASPLLVTQPDVRRFVRRLIAVDLPSATVLSYQELSPEVTVQTLGRVGV